MKHDVVPRIVPHPRVLAAMGDVYDVNCWSNIPYYFLKAGQKVGFSIVV